MVAFRLKGESDRQVTNIKNTVFFNEIYRAARTNRASVFRKGPGTFPKRGLLFRRVKHQCRNVLELLGGKSLHQHPFDRLQWLGYIFTLYNFE